MAVGRLCACVAVAWLALLPAATPADASSVRVVSHGDGSRPLIALTFDDGVSPDNCRRILSILVAKDVPATFFPIAEAMSLDPVFWRLVGEVGDPVGDHTFSHPQLPALGVAAQTTEIERGRTVAEAILGRPIARVMRPPYGAYDAATLTAAANAGFGTLVLWDVSDRDTSLHGTVAQREAAAEQGTNGSIVLMHCGPNATPYLLADVIAWYRARGFRFVTIPELLGVPWSPGPTRAVTPDEILGGLTPLPPSPVGGAITGPDGYTPPPSTSPARPGATPTPRPSPVPTPTPRPSPVPTPSPSPSVSPSPMPTSSPSEPPAPSPGASSSAGPSAASPSDIPASASPGATRPPSSPADATPAAALIGGIGLVVLVLAVGSLALARRSRPR